MLPYNKASVYNLREHFRGNGSAVSTRWLYRKEKAARLAACASFQLECGNKWADDASCHFRFRMKIVVDPNKHLRRV